MKGKKYNFYIIFEKLNDFEDLRFKLEGSSAYQIENLKTAFNTQLNVLHCENQDFNFIIENKNKEI